MSTLAQNKLTLLDWAKRQDPNNKTARIIELLAQTNQILEDIPFIEGNLPTGHKTTVRTGLPDVFWRLLNQGVQPTKSTTTQITEGIGMLEAWSEVDVKLAKLGGDVGAFRLSESKPFLESMNIELASTLFYGNSSIAPEEFNGLSVRYSSKSAQNGENIILGGGAGADNSSIWLVCWDESTVHGIYPKGSQAGLEHEDLGEQTLENAGGNGLRMRVYQEKWCWQAGLALKDWRFAVRIPNIDISNLVSKTSAADLLKLMTFATHAIPNIAMGQARFYMNRTVFQMLDIQRFDAVQAGGGITWETVDGKPIPKFRGIPIRICDALLENEALVS